MKKEFDRIKFRYDRNRKLKNTVQIAKLKSYISACKAIETFSEEIAEMANNPFISHDPEAILLNLKDYCTKRFKFSIDEKNKAHTELKALIGEICSAVFNFSTVALLVENLTPTSNVKSLDLKTS